MADHIDYDALIRKAHRERSKAVGDAVIALFAATWASLKRVSSAISEATGAFKRAMKSPHPKMPTVPIHR